MNIYKSLNEMINYIEENLENAIEYDKLCKILGVNEYTMQRLFSLLCNISVSEYIRKRRLSNAGYDLYNTDTKVIDVAIKYQYDNATSFSRAFEKFHGIKPSNVKKTPNGLKTFPKIVFDEKVETKTDFKYDIIELNELILYGVGKKTTFETIEKDAPNFFKEVMAQYRLKYGTPSYGMVVYEDRFESHNYEYWVLYDKKIEEFEKYVIPKSKWLLFRIDSQKSEDIHKLSSKFYVDFVPSTKYNYRDLPELEYYHDGLTDFLVPIED